MTSAQEDSERLRAAWLDLVGAVFVALDLERLQRFGLRPRAWVRRIEARYRLRQRP